MDSTEAVKTPTSRLAQMQVSEKYVVVFLIPKIYTPSIFYDCENALLIRGVRFTRIWLRTD